MKKLKLRLTAVDAEIIKLQAERRALSLQIAALSTTVKVGDRVTVDGKPDVYQVTEILPGWRDDKPKIMGAKIKKDGTPGAVARELYTSFGGSGIAFV